MKYCDENNCTDICCDEYDYCNKHLKIKIFSEHLIERFKIPENEFLRLEKMEQFKKQQRLK